MADYKEEVKRLQEKKQSVLQASTDTKQLAHDVMDQPQGMQTGTHKYKPRDTIRERYVKILEHDFTGEDWIVEDQERKVKINKHYRAVTGAEVDLAEQIKESRSGEVEKRREVSLSASMKLADYIKQGGQTWYFKEEENISEGDFSKMLDRAAGKVQGLKPEIVEDFKAMISVSRQNRMYPAIVEIGYKCVNAKELSRNNLSRLRRMGSQRLGGGRSRCGHRRLTTTTHLRIQTSKMPGLFRDSS